MYNKVGFDTASVSAAVCTFQCLAGTRVLVNGMPNCRAQESQLRPRLEQSKR